MCHIFIISRCPIMCDRKSLNTRAAQALVLSQETPSQNPAGGGSLCGSAESAVRMNQDVVDCHRPMRQDDIVNGCDGIVEEESLFERVKKKLRQAAMIATSPSKMGTLDSRSRVPGSNGHKKKLAKKTRHSWHQEIA